MASLPAVPLPLCSQDVLQNGKTKEEVRGTLLDGLDRCLGCQGAKPNIVEEEVDHFLQRGRVSDSNLSRLQRRVQAKLGQGGRSACGSVSSYSARTERSRSSFVESPRSCAYDALVPLALPEEGDKMPRVPEDEVLRWSNLAKLATKAAQLEDAQKREAQRKAQQQMRACLQEQVEQKTLRQKKDAEDEMKFFQSQTADLERWKQDQKKLAEERKEKMKQVVRDRKANTEEVLRSKEVERKRRSSEDRRLILRAAKEMELERQAVEERKHASQVAQSVLLQDIRAKKGPKEARQLRIQEEKQALAEYSLLLERQEARSQESKPRIRDQNPAAPPQAARKGVELYYDPDTVMRIRNEALAREEQVDKEKEERQRTERQMNQAYLFQQIAEREEKKKVILEEEKDRLKAVEAAAKEHRVAEQQRLHAEKMKNCRYRLELDRQIRLKKTMQQFQEDEMSEAEKDMNRQYVMEAIQKTSVPFEETQGF
ncbi:unnamed protein product [Durusdinium trenchii]|uniref:Uncharacterized protein n=1 Tax=Durusdinium trenchii TaxID=1381693 RepID=A0ABP0HD11_9DINO